IGMRTGELSVDDLCALERQAAWRIACRLDHERARVLLDHLHGLALAERGERRHDRGRGGIDPTREKSRDVAEARHRPATRVPGVSSISSRHVRMRYGSVP